MMQKETMAEFTILDEEVELRTGKSVCCLLASQKRETASSDPLLSRHHQGHSGMIWRI